ncbi:MAG TPA: hypothetical protein VEL47_08350 [Myxococcota bacterium]|nr:hypothetical protein [Myxococcota bacterium]
MSKLIAALLFLFVGLSCGKPNETYIPSEPPEHSHALEPLIKEGKVEITRDGSLEVISVFGPNQYQTTGTFDCWIHAPFNAWRLFEGNSIESFAGKDWEANLVKEIEKFKKERGITERRRAYTGARQCLTQAQILKPMANSPDFFQIQVTNNKLYLEKDGEKGLFSLNPSLNADLRRLTKADYAYFSTDPKGKNDLASFVDYLKNCTAILRLTSVDLLGLSDKCVAALNEKIAHNTYTDNAIKTTIDDYLAGKDLELVRKINPYITYHQLMKDFRDKIERLRSGHQQIITLGINDRSEYPLDHLMAAKILPPTADTIIVVNSENRHLGAIKTLKMLQQIFNLPLPEELK